MVVAIDIETLLLKYKRKGELLPYWLCRGGWGDQTDRPAFASFRSHQFRSISGKITIGKQRSIACPGKAILQGRNNLHMQACRGAIIHTASFFPCFPVFPSLWEFGECWIHGRIFFSARVKVTVFGRILTITKNHWLQQFSRMTENGYDQMSVRINYNYKFTITIMIL